MKIEMKADRKTYFFDIDGTLIVHKNNLSEMIRGDMDILDGTIETLLKLRSQGHYIVLTTARPEGVREATVRQLHDAGIFFDQLIMGLPTGPRIVVNDEKPDGMQTAYAVNLKRDVGIYNMEI